jgi:hypothetical protein
MGLFDRDTRFNIDRTASVLLDFGDAHSVGTAARRWPPISACRYSARGAASR